MAGIPWKIISNQHQKIINPIIIINIINNNIIFTDELIALFDLDFPHGLDLLKGVPQSLHIILPANARSALKLLLQHLLHRMGVILASI